MSFQQYNSQPPRSARSSYTPEPLSRAEPRDTSFESTNQRFGTGSMLNPSYNKHGHSSPYVEGKKNSSFVHPNLTSSSIFYDHNYAYKNDLPNPKLLGTVKNDRYATQQDEKPLSRSMIMSQTGNDDRRSVSPAFGRTIQTKPFATDADERFETVRGFERSGSLSSRNSTTSDMFQRSGSFSTTVDRPYEAERGARTERNPLPVLEEEQEEGVQQARGSTAHGKFCPDCVNTSQKERKSGHKESEKKKERELLKEWSSIEQKRESNNHDMERARRVIEAKEALEANSHRELAQYKQMYEKEKPTDNGGMVIDAIYDKQAERARHMKAMQTNLRGHNLDKMLGAKEKKEDDRIDRLTSEFNSLQVGEGYYNRYMTQPQNITKHLNKQMVETQNRKVREKDNERKIEQEIVEANLQALEREKQFKKEKVENYKQMLQDQLSGRAQDRTAAKEMEKSDNAMTRYYDTQVVEDLKSKQREDYLVDKKNKAVFRQNLKEHQEIAGYKKLREQKKQYYEGTGNSLPLGKKAETHDCTGCNKPHEKRHLSHKH